MSKLKLLLRPKKTTLINLKVTTDERAQIQKKADQFAEGNVSEWIRYAAAKHVPAKADLVEADAQGT